VIEDDIVSKGFKGCPGVQADGNCGAEYLSGMPRDRREVNLESLIRHWALAGDATDPDPIPQDAPSPRKETLEQAEITRLCWGPPAKVFIVVLIGQQEREQITLHPSFDPIRHEPPPNGLQRERANCRTKWQLAQTPLLLVADADAFKAVKRRQR
jgi:hypothetical protein